MDVTLALTEGSEENFEQKVARSQEVCKEFRGRMPCTEALVTTRDPTLDAVADTHPA